MKAYVVLKQEIDLVQKEWTHAVEKGSTKAILRIGGRIALLLFLAAFKWTIPLAVLFLVRLFGGI